MSHDIKSLRPSKKSRYEQGYVNPNTCKKVFESQRGIPIIFRSSLEKKFVIIRELQIKTRVSYHYTPVRAAKIQNTDNTKFW